MAPAHRLTLNTAAQSLWRCRREPVPEPRPSMRHPSYHHTAGPNTSRGRAGACAATQEGQCRSDVCGKRLIQPPGRTVPSLRSGGSRISTGITIVPPEDRLGPMIAMVGVIGEVVSRFDKTASALVEERKVATLQVRLAELMQTFCPQPANDFICAFTIEKPSWFLT
jgi:hypothetical protein